MPLRSNANNYGLKNITVTPTNITYAAGRTGQNAVFNGTTSVIKTNYTWNPTTGWTIAGWAKRTGTAGCIVRNETKYSPTLDWNLNGNVVRAFFWKNSSTASAMCEFSTIPPVNEWHFYTATYDKQYIKLYIDGELKTSVAETADCYNTGTLNIGWSSATNYFAGSLAEIRVYNYALTESEIHELSLACIGHWMLNGMNLIATDKTEYDGNIGRKGSANNALQGRKSAGSPRYQNCFNANGSYISLGSVPYAGVIDEFAYNYWAYAPTWDSSAFGSASYGGILNCVESGGWGLQFIKSGASLGCAFHNGSSYVMPSVPAWNTWSPGWHMITATTNGLETCIYLDGVLQGSSTASSKFTINHKNYPFIGYECSGTHVYSNGQFKGKISEVQFFAKHLSADEVRNLYAKAHIPT